MAIDSLMPTLDAAGYVKVIVALKTAQPEALAAGGMRAGAARTGRPRTGIDPASVMSLQNHFLVPPSAGEQAGLAAGARTRAAAGSRAKSVAPQPPRMRVFPRLGLVLGSVDASGAAALDADDRVASVLKAPELSLIRPVAVRAAGARAKTTWGLKRLGVERLWEAGYRGAGVRVGHLDTGIDGSHPALQGAIAEFAEFDMAGNIVPGAKAHDSGEHGTHTGGTIAGRETPKGQFGVAPEASLVSGMVIEGGQVIDRILSGLEWVVEKNCKVLSMSLGLRGVTPAFQVVVDALRAAGVLPVIAVGNEYANTSRSPGNYANVLSVGAMDANETVADFSGSQRFNRPNEPLVPSLVAPGVGVLSCVPGGKFAEMDGSSMATPHVAGLAALLFCAKPAATIAEVEQAILASCERPETMPMERANRGVPDAARAFHALTGIDLPSPAAVASSRRASTARRARTAAAKAKPKRKPKPAARRGRRTA